MKLLSETINYLINKINQQNKKKEKKSSVDTSIPNKPEEQLEMKQLRR